VNTFTSKLLKNVCAITGFMDNLLVNLFKASDDKDAKAVY